MPICSICKAENPENAPACFSCGSPLASVANQSGNLTLWPGATLQQGRYSVGKVLGQGGFGITYLGSDLNDRSPVAIKEFFLQGCSRQGTTVTTGRAISSENFELVKKRFIDEGKVLSQFVHAGIVKVRATFEENNTAYVVMEYLKGKTLQQILAERGVIPEAGSGRLHNQDRRCSHAGAQPQYTSSRHQT